MISEFETNTIYFSEHLQRDKLFKNTHEQLVSVLSELGLTPKYLQGTNDIWARDYMPIQVAKDKLIEYRYDPDYLQGNSNNHNTREIKSYPDIICDLHNFKTKKSQIILDGGNVVKSQNCIILTDKVISENQHHFTAKQLVTELHDIFEVEKVIIIPWDDECVFGHADGMLRFINKDTVLISGFYEQFDNDFRKPILRELEKAKLNFDWLRFSDLEVPDNATYINFLLTKDVLIIPQLERLEDEIAIYELSKFFPDYLKNNKIKKVNSKELTKFGGSLNCISWTTVE